MPRRARAPSEMSTVLLPMPSMTAWQPTPSVTCRHAWCHVGMGQRRVARRGGSCAAEEGNVGSREAQMVKRVGLHAI